MLNHARAVEWWVTWYFSQGILQATNGSCSVANIGLLLCACAILCVAEALVAWLSLSYIFAGMAMLFAAFSPNVALLGCMWIRLSGSCSKGLHADFSYGLVD